MSRLEGFIRRMEAQKAHIDRAVSFLKEPNTIFEFGIGAGRTLDHLVQSFPKTPIFAFENDEQCLNNIPSNSNVTPVLGDIFLNLPIYAEQYARRTSLIHVDIGGAFNEQNKNITKRLTPYFLSLLSPSGILISSIAVEAEPLQGLPVLPGIRRTKYHSYYLKGH